MEWALAIVALALIAVAAVSKRLPGHAVTTAMLFVSIGLLAGPEGLDGIDISSTSSTVRTLAEATLALVLFSDASRIDLGKLREDIVGADSPARHRAAADDRARSARRRPDLRSADHRRGGHPGGDPGAHRRRARPGGRDRAPRPEPDPPGAQHRERAQRRDLRAAAVRRRRRRGRRIEHLLGAKRVGSCSRRSATGSSAGSSAGCWSGPSSSTPAAGI